MDEIPKEKLKDQSSNFFHKGEDLFKQIKDCQDRYGYGDCSTRCINFFSCGLLSELLKVSPRQALYETWNYRDHFKLRNKKRSKMRI